MKNRMIVFIFIFLEFVFLNTYQTFSAFPLQKILIMTPVFNHPEYIQMQQISFKKYLQDDYEYIVFNDALDEKISQEIDAMCKTLTITCIRVPQENREIGTVFSWATYRHAYTMQYMMKTLGFDYDGIVVLLDSDMFLIKQFSVRTYLGDYDIAGLRQGPRDSETEYLWPGLIFLKMNTLPNKKTMSFAPEVTDTVRQDSGGSLYHYFNAHPLVKKLFFEQEGRLRLHDSFCPFYLYALGECGPRLKCLECKKMSTGSQCFHVQCLFRELGFRDTIIDLIVAKKVPKWSEFLLIDTFFHAEGSSGYGKMGPKKRKRKEACVHNFLTHILGLE